MAVLEDCDLMAVMIQVCAFLRNKLQNRTKKFKDGFLWLQSSAAVSW